MIFTTHTCRIITLTVGVYVHIVITLWQRYNLNENKLYEILEGYPVLGQS